MYDDIYSPVSWWQVLVMILIFLGLGFLLAWMVASQYRECTLTFTDGTTAVDINCVNTSGTTFCRNASYRSYKSMKCVDQEQPK